MTAPEVQIVFQGGGAKFIAMLPVAEAFQFCEANGRVNVKAVAGTSAGAICAALLAAGCNFRELRTYLNTAGSEHVRKLVGNRADQLKAIANASGWPSRAKATYNAAPLLKSLIRDGNPLFNEDEFGIFLDQILARCADGTQVIEKLTKSLSIVTTDIAKSSGHIIRTGGLKAALRDSCALPIAFRSFRYLSINHHVDGGLCENLPVECLKTHSKAPIFAVFPEETSDGKPIDNIFLYLLSLFGASIDHNVKRSKAMVANAFQIPVQTPFSTFDFIAALEMLKNEYWYDAIKTRTIDMISDFSHVYGRVENSRYYRVDDTREFTEYMETMANMSVDYAEHVEMKQSKITVKVNCADVRTDGSGIERRPADSVTKQTVLIVKSEKFRYFRSSIYQPSTAPSVWRALNKTRNKELPIKVLSLDSTPLSSANQFCIVEFLEPREHIAIGDEIEISDILSRKDAMEEMNKRREEFISITNTHDYILDLAELAVIYPKTLGRFELLNDDERGSVRSDDAAKIDVPADFDCFSLGMACKKLGPREKLFCRIVPR